MSTKEIPIYIINLDRSPDRLCYMSEQLSKTEVPFERIVAVDGSQLEVEALQYFQRQSKRSWSHYGFMLSNKQQEYKTNNMRPLHK
jgi:GR25 family glycosyltransferase involved in LPS biosynthesis